MLIKLTSNQGVEPDSSLPELGIEKPGIEKGRQTGRRRQGLGFQTLCSVWDLRREETLAGSQRGGKSACHSFLTSLYPII